MSVAAAAVEIVDPLVPPPEMLFDGAVTAEEFKELGMGFTCNTLIGRAMLKPAEDVLDMGCGNGQKARVLAGYLTTGRYEGVDIVRSGIEWCQEAYRPYENFRFSVADIQSSHYNPEGSMQEHEYVFPFEDESFDLVFLCSVFTHMLPAGTENYIREIQRVLRPGGRCVATFFLLNEQSRRAVEAGTSAMAFPGQLDGCRVRDIENPTEGVAHDEANIRRMYADAGLSVAEVNYGRWPGTVDMLHAFQDIVLAIKNCDPAEKSNFTI